METDEQALIDRYRSARHDDTVAVLEGFHALKHAIRFGADILDARAASPDDTVDLARELAPDLVSDDGGPLRPLLRPTARSLYARLAPSAHPTGVIALARRPPMDVDALLAGDDGPIVFLDRPAHHGNIGAVVRVAAAAGAGGVLTTGMHDPWHPSSVRGAAGLQLALPVARVERLPAVDRPVVVLDPDGEPLGSTALPDRAVLVFGSERHGVSDGLLARADRRLAIPMRPGVSSLNLATSVAVALYCGTA